MNQTWLTGVPEDQQERFKKEFNNSRPVLDRLIQILEDKYKAADADANKREHYLKPAWSEYQADRIGTKRVLREIQNLLEK